MEQYLQAFEDNDVDEQTLGLLTEADLADMGVTSVGHRRRLAEAIAALAGEPALPAAVAPPWVDAEQRQLTVLYCQMVDHIAVPTGSKADPEARRRVIQDFRVGAAQFPGPEERRPIDIIGDFLQGQAVKHACAQEAGFHRGKDTGELQFRGS